MIKYKNVSIKKLFSICILTLYLFSYILSSLFYVNLNIFSIVNAQNQTKNINLIGIFVDKNISDFLNDDLNFYSSYIQSKLESTKALIIPIDINQFGANEIKNMIENLYFIGEKNGSTNLKGIVLIGNIPLPVLNNNGNIFTSIYPYVDLKNEKYEFNEKTGYFDFNGNYSSLASIWHGIINFGDDTQKYKNYFSRLKNYSKDPISYIGKKFWYEDYIGLKQNFTDINLDYYLNGILFLEDISYKRYTPLLLNIFMNNHSDFFNKTTQDYQNSLLDLYKKSKEQLKNADKEFDILKPINEKLFKEASKFQERYMSGDLLNATNSAPDETPTLVISNILEAFFRDYNSLFSNLYFSKLKQNISQGGRYNIQDIDNHITKSYFMDSLTKILIYDYNNQLEQQLENKFNEDSFQLYVPNFTYVDDYENKFACFLEEIPQAPSNTQSQENGGESGTGTTQESTPGPTYNVVAFDNYFLTGRYENFYFGRSSSDLKSLNDLSIYNGTYQNFKQISQISGFILSTQDDINQAKIFKSVGATFGVFKSQTQSNRGLNMFLASDEGNNFADKRCSNYEMLDDFMKRWWGGNSPLNIDTTSSSSLLNLKFKNYFEAWNPSYDKSIGGPIFDIAGSNFVESEQTNAYGYLGLNSYSSIIKTMGAIKENNGDDDSKGAKYKKIDMIYCMQNKIYKDTNKLDYFNIYGNKVSEYNSGGFYIDIIVNGSNGQQKETRGSETCLCSLMGSCDLNGFIRKIYFNYNLIDSLKTNKSPTQEQLSGMNIMTTSRPIDTPRNMTFLGIGGDFIKFVYPNLFNVEVFKKDGEKLVLKSEQEIKESIKLYLQKKVEDYNLKLNDQLGKSSNFYSQNKSAYDFLETVDKRATPNRSYSLLEKDFFINYLGEKNIDRIAHNLYYLNSGFGRVYLEGFDQENFDIFDFIDRFKKNFDINKKIKFVNDNYLRSDSNFDNLTNPTIEQNGYEIGYINSDFNDYIQKNDDFEKTKLEIEKLSKIDSYNMFAKVGKSISEKLVQSDINNIKKIQAEEENGFPEGGKDKEKEYKDCSIPKDLKVDLFKWPSTFSCYNQKSMEKPEDLEIDPASDGGTFLNSYGNDSKYFGSVFKKLFEKSKSGGGGGGGGDFAISNIFSLNDKGEFTKPTTIISNGVLSGKRLSKEEFEEIFSGENFSGYVEGWESFVGSDELKNQANQKIMSDSQKEIFKKIENNIVVSFLPNQTISLENYEQEKENYFIKIGSLEDLGKLDIKIGLVGENCLLLDDKDICNQDYLISTNPYKNEIISQIKLKNMSAGVDLFQFEFCLDKICYNKNYFLYINHGELVKFDVNLLSENMIVGGKMPFEVVGLDKYNNRVGKVSQNYVLSTDIGELEFQNAKSDKFLIDDFGESFFVLDSSKLTDLKSFPVDLKLSIKVDDFDANINEDVEFPKFEKIIKIVDSDFEFYNSKGEKINNIDLYLGDTLDEYYTKDSNGVININLQKFEKFKVKLVGENIDKLTLPIIPISKNGYVDVGIIVSRPKNLYEKNNNRTVSQLDFQKMDYITIENGEGEFYIYPKFKAGKDELIFSMYGNKEKKINLNIFPSIPRKVDVVFKDKEKKLGEIFDGNVFVFDNWGNITTNRDLKVDVGVYGNAEIDKQKKISIDALGGSGTIQVNSLEPGGNIKVFARLLDDDKSKYYIDIEEIVANNVLWPMEKLNIMYLNLYGSSWGDLGKDGINYNNYATKILENSDKLLSITTLGAHPRKLKKYSLILRNDLKIINLNNFNIELKLENGNIIYDFVQDNLNIGKILAGSINDFKKISMSNFPDILKGDIFVYVPTQTDDNVTSNYFEDNSLYINNVELLNFKNSYIDKTLKIVLNKTQEKLTKFDVFYNSKFVGNIYLNKDNNYIDGNINNKILLDKSKFGFEIGNGDGSSNGKKGIMIYYLDQKKYEQFDGYKSIQNSNDIDSNIGFVGSFKPITNFSNGNNVGESTKAFGSEYLINLGDPLVERINNNSTIYSTNFDGGVGKNIFQDTKSILKTLQIDYNKDGLNDLLIAYFDGTIRLLKNFGGKDNFVDIGELLKVSDGLNDIFVKDSNNDGFEDLYVISGKNKIRVYKNFNGNFEIDGYVICLDKKGDSDKYDYLSQFLVDDFNNDGYGDILTNDEAGNVKLYYGGVVSGKNTYISENKQFCDNNFKERLKGNVKQIADFGLSLNEEKVLDTSIVHRFGLKKNTSTNNIGKDYNELVKNSMKYVNLYKNTYPVFESSNTQTVDYIYISYLGENDKVNIYKTFNDLNGGKLEIGDLVKVNVHLIGNENTIFTFADYINGPYILTKNNDGIVGLDKGNLPKNSNFIYNDIDYGHYVLDNIEIGKGVEYVYSYILTFKGEQTTRLKIEDFNGDGFKDIKAIPNDSSIKGIWKFFNKDGQNFEERFDDLTQPYKQRVENIVNNQKKSIQNFDNKIQDIIQNFDKKSIDELGFDVNKNLDSNNSKSQSLDFSKIKSILDPLNLEFKVEASEVDKNSTKNIILLSNNNLNNGGSQSNVDMDLGAYNQMIDGSKGKLYSELEGLCKENKFGKKTCDQLPIPHNDAPNSPGHVNQMGCSAGVDPGVPSFWFPGTKWIPSPKCGIPVPTPNHKTKVGPPTETSASAGCKDTPVFDSKIRIYRSQTATNASCVNFCFGSYNEGMNIGAPDGNFKGNCVVTYKPVNLKDCNNQSFSSENGNVGQQQESESLEQYQFEMQEVGSSDSKPGTNSSTSMGGKSYNSNKRASSTKGNSSSVGQGEVDKVNGNDTQNGYLKPGTPVDLKIQSGEIKGLVNCSITSRLDNQIRQVINDGTDQTMYLNYPNYNVGDQGAEQIHQLPGTMGQQAHESGADSAKHEGSIQNYEQASSAYSNPYDRMQNYFKEVPMVNIQKKELIVQVPGASPEEISRQITYLQGRLDSNTSKASKLQARGVDTSTLFNNVRQNIKTLNTYKEYPSQMSQYVHSSDEYMKQLSKIVDKHSKDKLEWLEKNKEGLKSWVDYYESLNSVFETWQVMIDFATKWRLKCSKCRKDDYDIFSCLLDSMCMDLKIMPLPPFKLPDVYADLGNFDKGVDVLMPEYKFVPIRFPTSKIPDLPDADNLKDSAVIPSVSLYPQLPKPQEVPSFMPKFDAKYPNLPPPPKIPDILPAIKQIIDNFEYIGKLLCILKHNIGTEAEWSVRPRCEQNTQREWRVEPYDYSVLTKIQKPVQGDDAQLETKSNPRLRFDDFYNFSKGVADSINKGVGSMDQSVTTKVVPLSPKIKDSYNNNSGIEKKLNAYLDNSKDYDLIRSRIYDELIVLKSYNYGDEFKQSVDNILSDLYLKPKINVNYEGIEIINDEFKNIVEEQSKKLNDIKEKIKNDYEGFLKEIQKETLISNNNTSTILSSKMYLIDNNSLEKFKIIENPIKQYTLLNKPLIDGLKQKLNTKSSEQLNMKQDEYDKTKLFMNEVGGLTDNILGIFGQTGNKLDENIVSNAQTPNNDFISYFDQDLVDLTQYIKGFYSKGTDGDYYKILNDDVYGEELNLTNKYFYSDLNKDGVVDLINYDSRNVYVKYGNQNIEFEKGGTHFNSFYKFSNLSLKNSKIDQTDSLGFMKIGNEYYKLDGKWAIKDFKSLGNSNNNVSFSWNNISGETPDGYVLKIGSSIDEMYNLTDKNSIKYILVVNKNFDEKTSKIYIPGELDLGFVYDYMKDSKILNLYKINELTTQNVSLTIESLPKKWNYIKLGKLSSNFENRGVDTYGTFFGTQTKVGGFEIFGDSISPFIYAKLYRIADGENIGNGDILNGSLNTKYKIVFELQDDSGIRKTDIYHDGKLIKSSNSAKFELEDIYFSKEGKFEYKITSYDNVGNIAHKKLLLNIKVPELNIIKIQKNSDIQSTIEAKLSDKIDDGKVMFEINRNGNWEILTGVENSEKIDSFDIGQKTILTGGNFSMIDSIDLIDSLGIKVGFIDTNNGKISILNGYNGKIDLNLKFNGGNVFINILNTMSNMSMFDLYLEPKNIIENGIEIFGNVKLLNLNSSIYKTYNGGYCIKRDFGECLVLISKNGEMFVTQDGEMEVFGKYFFDDKLNCVVYSFFDFSGNKLFDFKFIPKKLK